MALPAPAKQAPAFATLALTAGLVAMLVAGCTGPQARRLRRFQATLAAHDSATAALRQWCAAEGIADPAGIAAQKLAAGLTGSGEVAADAAARATLALADGEPLGYRHVRLTCGDIVLSEAHNWYAPARLTPDMNAALAETDRPFGTVAASLGFRRQPLDSVRRPVNGCPADTVLANRAVLRLPDGRPLALLVECYLKVNVAGPKRSR